MSNTNTIKAVAANAGSDNDDCLEGLFENPVSKLLHTYPSITNEIIKNILSKDIKFKDLSSLNEEDLRLFGVQNEDIQQQIVDDFAARLHQEIRLSKYLADLNEREYKEKIYRNIFEHLEAIRITLAACQLKMKAEPIKENMLVTPDTYASTITTKALQQLTNTAKDLQLMLINKNGKPKSQWLQWIAGGSVIIGCIAIYKCILKK